ncbi:MAG: hypothetical protein Q9216_000647 [Gyalolechia sp. 2 TL-2023]
MAVATWSFAFLGPLSFVMTKISYNALPISAFTTLQKRVFPAYFRLQSLLILVTAATHPPHGPLSLFKSLGDVAPLAIGGTMAALNLTVYGPRTQTTMIDRIHQGEFEFFHPPSRERFDADGSSCATTETRDGKKYTDPNCSEEMKAKNRAFSRAHAMSIHINLLAIGSTIWYGFRLASKLRIVAV